MKFYMIAFLSAAIVASNFVAKAQEENIEVVSKKDVAKKSLTQDDMLDLLNDALTQVQMGAIYSSSLLPDDLYQVLTVALDSNEQQVVVYQALFGINAIWVRPLSEWIALVDVDGNLVPQYQLLDSVNSVFTAEVVAEDVVVDTQVSEDVVATQEVLEAAAEEVLEVVENAVVETELSENAVVETEVSEDAVAVAEEVSEDAVCASCLASAEAELTNL